MSDVSPVPVFAAEISVPPVMLNSDVVTVSRTPSMDKRTLLSRVVVRVNACVATSEEYDVLTPRPATGVVVSWPEITHTSA